MGRAYALQCTGDTESRVGKGSAILHWTIQSAWLPGYHSGAGVHTHTSTLSHMTLPSLKESRNMNGWDILGRYPGRHDVNVILVQTVSLKTVLWNSHLFQDLWPAQFSKPPRFTEAFMAAASVSLVRTRMLRSIQKSIVQQIHSRQMAGPAVMSSAWLPHQNIRLLILFW